MRKTLLATFAVLSLASLANAQVPGTENFKLTVRKEASFESCFKKIQQVTTAPIKMDNAAIDIYETQSNVEAISTYMKDDAGQLCFE